MNNIIPFQSRRQGKTFAKLGVIKFATTHLKQNFMYYCSNSAVNQSMLNRMIPHLVIEIVDNNWLKITPCECLKNDRTNNN